MNIGILGAGQLGRMLALAGYPLGCSFRFFDPTPPSAVSAVAPHMCEHYSNTEALDSFIKGLDAVTYEFENVPVEAAEYVASRVALQPGIEALRVAQDRFAERECFRKLGIPVVDSIELPAVQANESHKGIVSKFGVPCVLKARRLGYDGKGQAVVRSEDKILEALSTLKGQDVIVERLVEFTRELSIIAVRGRSGDPKFYPLIENVHHQGILRTSRCPANRVGESLQQEAEDFATRVLAHFSYVGVLTIELFEVNGKLVANEMAPRVHNSGHFSIEGSETSQFENHIRAVMGMPLGSTRPKGSSLMVNLIGVRPDAKKLLAMPQVHFHWYGKAPREGRKVGHVTAVFKGSEERDSKAQEVLACARGT